MKTEKVTFDQGDPAKVVSRALQDLAPISCEILDRHDRPVPFSSAGYVLKTGEKYKLRIVPPREQAIISIQSIASPDFLRLDDKEIVEHDAQGCLVWDIPFRVRDDDGTARYKIATVYSDELEIRLTFKAGTATRTIPIVVRPGLTLAILAAAGTVLSLGSVPLASFLVKELSAKGETEGIDVWDQATRWLSHPWLWTSLAVLALLVTGIYGYIVFKLKQREKILREDFESKYPSVSHSSSQFAPLRPVIDK